MSEELAVIQVDLLIISAHLRSVRPSQSKRLSVVVVRIEYPLALAIRNVSASISGNGR